MSDYKKLKRKFGKFEIGDTVIINYGRHYNGKNGLTRVGIVAQDIDTKVYCVNILNSRVVVVFADICKLLVIKKYLKEEIENG